MLVNGQATALQSWWKSNNSSGVGWGSQVSSVTSPGDVNAFCGDLSHLIWIVHLLCRGDRLDFLCFIHSGQQCRVQNTARRDIMSCFSSCLHPISQLSSRKGRLVSKENNGMLMRALLPGTAGSCTLALVVVLENMEYHILLFWLHRFPCCANPRVWTAVQGIACS